MIGDCVLRSIRLFDAHVAVFFGKLAVWEPAVFRIVGESGCTSPEDIGRDRGSFGAAWGMGFPAIDHGHLCTVLGHTEGGSIRNPGQMVSTVD